MPEHGAQQHLVFLDPDPDLSAFAEQCIALGGGLYIYYTGLSRSRLYHRLKAAHHPERLLVAPLADDPKFKGMAAGALKTLRLQTKTHPTNTLQAKQSVHTGNSSLVADGSH